MISKRPPAVVFLAAWQMLLGLIAFYRVGEHNMPLWWIGLTVMGVWHVATAVGLYHLNEWARQRSVQLAVFDLFALLKVLFPYPSPFFALISLGMPLYSLTVLTDPNVRRRFS
ncbi:MAG: hypothetical protein HUU35_08460 [Armatimonadetes bacterium]|nr:hypothetical protein [Armatimonadota bacterium]